MTMNDSRPQQPERRWNRFRLRTLLALLLVAGTGFGWLGAKLQRAGKNRVAMAEVHKVQAELRRSGAGPVEVEIEPLQSPNWLGRLLGDPGGFARVAVYGNASLWFRDSHLKHLKGLSSLQILDLNGTQVTDAGLEHLKGLTGLKYLSLTQTQVTGPGLEHLKPAFPR
jgi:hypothetical protein